MSITEGELDEQKRRRLVVIILAIERDERRKQSARRTIMSALAWIVDRHLPILLVMRRR